MLPADQLKEFATVSEWVKALPPMPQVKRKHLDALARWCEAEGSDPDALIAEGRSSRDAKLDAMRRLKAWVDKAEEGERARHDLQNQVRSFYIFHGLRVLTKPYSDVYNRPAEPEG